MWSSPEGYGQHLEHVRRRLGLRGSGPRSGFGTVNASSAAQIACHFASIASGSYRSASCSICSEMLPGNEKASRMRGSGGVGAAGPRFLPGLREKLLHDSHANRHDRPVLALFPESADGRGRRALARRASRLRGSRRSTARRSSSSASATLARAGDALRDAVGDGRVYFGTKALAQRRAAAAAPRGGHRRRRRLGRRARVRRARPGWAAASSSSTGTTRTRRSSPRRPRSARRSSSTRPTRRSSRLRPAWRRRSSA